MTKLEKLIDEYEDRCKFYDANFEDEDLKGLCIKNHIFLENSLSNAEKYCVLAEEIGHYETGTGNILDQTKVENRKQERHARLWASNKLMPMDKLIDELKSGVNDIYDLAERLNVTVDFIRETLDTWVQKYGCVVYIGENVLNLETLELF